MKKILTTATSDDINTMFHCLYKLEQHCEDRRMNAKQSELTNIIRKLNDMGFKEASK